MQLHQRHGEWEFHSRIHHIGLETEVSVCRHRRPSCPAAACNDFLYLRIKRETSCSSSGHWPLYSWKKAFSLSTEEFFVCLFRIKSGSTLSTSPQKNRLPSNSVGENVCFRERSLRGASSSLLSFLSLSLPPPCSEMSESQARGTNFPSSHVENLLPPSTHERTNTTLARTLPSLSRIGVRIKGERRRRRREESMTTTTHLPTRAWLLCVGPAARKTLRWKESLFACRAHTRLGSGGLALLPRASLVRSGKFFLLSRCSLARSCHASLCCGVE